MKLYLGRNRYPRRLSPYAERFNLAEVKAEKQRLPKLGELSAARKLAPEGFEFSVVLPRSCASLEDSPEAEAELAYAAKVTDCLKAGWLVLQTAHTVFPSERTRTKLVRWFERLRTPGATLCWEPLGVWEADEAERWGSELGVVAVVDASRTLLEPKEERYVRVRALGEASRLRPFGLETLAQNLEGLSRAAVVFEGDDAERSAKALRELLAPE
jgi:uncharacterized protein YecE (DUF72 family)